jgi:predicted DNA-binding protein (MmcQ/YjbR family)
MTKDAFHDRLIAIVNKLPGAYEDRPWGSVHCKVDEKIFVGWGRMDNGEMSLGIRVPIDDQHYLLDNDSRFTVAKYVGKYGGLDMRIGKSPDWAEVERYVIGSYRQIASKKRIKELDALTGGSSPAPAVKKKAPAKKGATAKAKVSKKAASAKPAAKRTKK